MSFSKRSAYHFSFVKRKEGLFQNVREQPLHYLLQPFTIV
ncbi:hypothetical protein B4168_1687 [Anoxybacillus flavithermus]|nr:hypothetical protein B4168_1687 [Anoxybacillus flavithermus]OAO84342.1 hypothetical protein GT23_3877 [Parageobacillus thermoglucosidasius]